MDYYKDLLISIIPQHEGFLPKWLFFVSEHTNRLWQSTRALSPLRLDINTYSTLYL